MVSYVTPTQIDSRILEGVAPCEDHVDEATLSINGFMLVTYSCSTLLHCCTTKLSSLSLKTISTHSLFSNNLPTIIAEVVAIMDSRGEVCRCYL